MFPNDCDVIEQDPVVNYLQNFDERVDQNEGWGMEGVYRDKDGALVSEAQYGWEEAKKKVANGDLEFGRSVETTRKYREKMTSLKQEWMSIDDYCKHAFLGYDVTMTKRDGKMVKKVDTKGASKVCNGLCIVENEFPYNLASEVRHLVLWAVYDFPQSLYEDFVNSHFPSVLYDVIMFENLPVNKSVKSVKHLHLFVKQKTCAHAQTHSTCSKL